MTELAHLLDACEFAGGAVAPPAVLALVTAARKLCGICARQAEVIHDGFVTDAQMIEISDAMADVRRVELPDMVATPVFVPRAKVG